LHIGHGDDLSFCFVAEPSSEPFGVEATAKSGDIEQRVAKIRADVDGGIGAVVAAAFFDLRLACLDNLAGGHAAVPDLAAPLGDDGFELLPRRVGLAGAFDRQAGISGTKPQDRLADGVAPAFEAA